MSSHSSHHPQEVLLAQFNLHVYVHKSGLKPDSFHYLIDSLVASPIKLCTCGMQACALCGSSVGWKKWLVAALWWGIDGGYPPLIREDRH